MINKVQAIEIGKVDEKITAAIQAADKILGWGSTGALVWLTNPKIYGIHVLVADESPSDGVVFRSPRLGECDWYFRLGNDGAIHGWSHGAEICLSEDRAFARSCGGHWFSATINKNGRVEIDVDDCPSYHSWGDYPDSEEPWLSSVEVKAMRIERIYRAMHAG